MKTLMTVTLLAFAIGSATASAQAPTSPPAKMTADEKKAISKSCSEQANAKGLHKKERTKFRAACIKAGGESQ
jgi:ABC-type transporter MlaC component